MDAGMSVAILGFALTRGEELLECLSDTWTPSFLHGRRNNADGGAGEHRPGAEFTPRFACAFIIPQPRLVGSLLTGRQPGGRMALAGQRASLPLWARIVDLASRASI